MEPDEMTSAADKVKGVPAVELRKVSFSYNSEPVIAGADFSVVRNEAVCMVGPNGGGKTTLFKLILGLERPDAGEIRVFGQPPKRARKRIGYVPQNISFDPQFPITVLEIVLMGRLGGRVLGPHSRQDKGAAFVALEQMRLAELSHRQFAELSVGQRQRVLIARALSSEPELLLLDEPTANVDSAVEAKIYEILDDLRSSMTVMMISHDLAFVSSIFDRVICVHETVAIHPTDEFTDDKLKLMYGDDFRIVRHDLGDQGRRAGGGRNHD